MTERVKTKKLYSIPEIYTISVNALRSMGDMKRGKAAGLMDERFQERIMLAVTAVNACAMCSYAHTGLALKAGMSSEEVRAFAEGDVPDIPLDEVKAVLFAQHYADTRGRIDREAWDALLGEYGERKALCILGAVRSIMFGNSVGIVLSSIGSRFREGHGDSRSSAGYELLVCLSILPIILVSLVHVLLLKLFRRPAISFK